MCSYVNCHPNINIPAGKIQRKRGLGNDGQSLANAHPYSFFFIADSHTILHFTAPHRVFSAKKYRRNAVKMEITTGT